MTEMGRDRKTENSDLKKKRNKEKLHESKIQRIQALYEKNSVRSQN